MQLQILLILDITRTKVIYLGQRIKPLQALVSLDPWKLTLPGTTSSEHVLKLL